MAKPAAVHVPLLPGAPFDYAKYAFQPKSWEKRGLSLQLIPWTGTNVIFRSSGRRRCRVCHAEELRRLRAEMRARGAALDPLALAAGLGPYSQRGDAYVAEIRGMIVVNGLDALAGVALEDEPAVAVQERRDGHHQVEQLGGPLARGG